MYVKKHGRDWAFPDYEPNYPRSPDFRVRHVKVDLRVHVYQKMIDGLATLDIESVKDGLRVIELDAVDMDIKSVKSDGRDLNYYYDGKVLQIELPNELAKGSMISVEIAYSAKPKKGLYFILPEEYEGVVPQVWSQGESEDNRYWIPMYDYPNIKCTSELIIHAPKEFTVVSNGKLINVKDEGDWKSWHWKMDKPHSPYLIALAIGIFDVIEDNVDGIPLRYYVPKGRRDDIMRSFSKTPDIIRFYSEYTGVPYPWDKYDQVCVSEFIFGGMENTTITILTDLTLHDEKAHMDFESEPLVAHEAAHQWVGDLVTTKDWGNIWLNESFATYFQALYTRHWKGEADFIYDLVGFLDRYLQEYGMRYARPIVTRVYKYASEVFDSHSYPKGALVLHTLKNIIGEDTFRQVLKRYLEKFKFDVADTEDFRKVVEEVTGKDFEWFFDQYVYNAGHPVLNINHRWNPEEKTLSISIKQTQPDDSWDVYKLPIEVLIITDSGREVKKTIWIKEKQETFHIPLDEKPKRVCIDPDFKTFAVLNIDQGQEQWIDQLLNCKHTYSRILAARALSKFKSSKVIEALKKAVIEDEFWGVSVEAANSLGKIGLSEAKQALLDAEKKVNHPRVRRAIMAALGNYREEEVARTLIRVLDNGEESYYVRATAAESLGKTKQDFVFDALKKALDIPSHNYVITNGAIRGLAELGSDECFEIIKARASRGNPTLIRATAIMALAKFPEKKETFDIINEASRDENYRIRAAAVRAALELMSPKLLPMLDRLSREDLDERIIRVSREVAQKIRKSLEKGVEYQKLREEIDKIKEENRKLIERITKLESKS